jgi:hypothetical protein
MSGYNTSIANPSTTKRIILAGMTAIKNLPLVNCFELQAIAFGAAPTRRINGRNLFKIC